MDNSNLEGIINQTLDHARQSGATTAEANIGSGTGFSVTARLGDVETVEHQNDKGLNITVYINTKKGSASTSDFSDQAIKDTVVAACNIAKNSSEDEFAGLIDPEYTTKHVPDLELCHPWEITTQSAQKIAIECENIARNYDDRISNSEGATVHTYSGSHIYGNSHGFVGGWDWSTHSIDCSVIAEQDGKMQRDGWYARCRDHTDLEKIESIAENAAKRTLMHLNSRKISTQSVPVIYEAPVASGLFSAFISAISGSSQFRKSSFLLNKIGDSVFPEYLNIREKPHLKKAIGSTPFDNDGMATHDRTLVDNGVLQGYVLSAYSARKLGMSPTGNAGGVHNLIVDTSNQDLNSLMRDMGTGLLITELIGFGVNQVTGDYSRGASGFWIENGEIQYPVDEITVAGNLADMYKHIVKIGNDIDMRGNIQTGSVLIENMTIAGN
ncbi:MAG: metalloprotease PmbA [Gammaproteobacteria bacterium]|jgi:PmbA protein